MQTWGEREPAEGEQKTPLSNQPQLIETKNRPLKKPHVVVRPVELSPEPHDQDSDSNSTITEKPCNPHVHNKKVMLLVLKYLGFKDLATCSLVCRTWAKFSMDPFLWRRLDVSNCQLTAAHLTGIIRRQPEILALDWTNVTKRQLAWLLVRLPQLRSLSLMGCTWSGVSALRTCSCPPLVSLTLGHVSGLNDASLRDVLSPPMDSRPGLVVKSSRLKYLKHLSLAGCDITDVALRYIAQHLPHVENLDLSSCGRVTDAGVALLVSSSTPTLQNLISLDLSNCKLLTEATLDHLGRCKALKRLDLRHTTQVSTQSIIKFAAKSMHNLHVTDVKLVQEKKKSA